MKRFTIDSIGYTQLRGRRRVIENALTRLSHFEKLGYEYAHVVLNSAGSGKDVERVQCVLGPIHQLIFWLEDLLCEVMTVWKIYKRGVMMMVSIIVPRTPFMGSMLHHMLHIATIGR